MALDVPPSVFRYSCRKTPNSDNLKKNAPAPYILQGCRISCICVLYFTGFKMLSTTLVAFVPRAGLPQNGHMLLRTCQGENAHREGNTPALLSGIDIPFVDQNFYEAIGACVVGW